MSIGRNSRTGSPPSRVMKKTAVNEQKMTRRVWPSRARRNARTDRLYSIEEFLTTPAGDQRQPISIASTAAS
jgi:hypothetical protein